jgi:transposase
MNTANKKTLTEERAPVEAGVTIKLGLDVHAMQITVVEQVDGLLPKPARQMTWEAFGRWVEEQVKTGVKLHSCYEAGPCGYGLHRKLTALGVKNLVVVPQRWDEQHQRVKTDGRDARELCNRLDRYVQGNTTAFAVVRVPTPEQEQARAWGRQRGAVVKERQRSVVRGHGLMLAQGVRAAEGWWRPADWRLLAPELPGWLREQVACWQSQAVRLDAEAERLTAAVAKLSAGQIVPKGVGALTAALLQGEVLDWARFKNRRQVGSYTGLCPSESSSGQKRLQGCVTKHGNPRLRHQLVEAVWRLLQWQPDYPPIQKLRAATGGRARKRAAVAAARRLAVDLWRLNTGQCQADKLGLTLATA